MALPDSSFTGRSVHWWLQLLSALSVTGSPDALPFAYSCACTPLWLMEVSALPFESSHVLFTETEVVAGLPSSNLPWKGRVCVSPDTLMFSPMNVPHELPFRLMVAPGARMELTTPVAVTDLAFVKFHST